MTKIKNALNSNGKKVNIKRARSNEKYTCKWCGDELIPKQGAINDWHFAHKTNRNHFCEREQRKKRKHALSTIYEMYLKDPNFILDANYAEALFKDFLDIHHPCGASEYMQRCIAIREHI